MAELWLSYVVLSGLIEFAVPAPAPQHTAMATHLSAANMCTISLLDGLDHCVELF